MSDKKQTPLQTLRQQIRDGREFQAYTREELGQMINALYPAEQQLISDIWDAATTTCMESGGPAEGLLWTKDDFLNQYKPEA